MVLESIMLPVEMERHPKRMLYIGFIYASVGLALGLFVFGSYASLASIFLAAMPLIVILYKAIELEEEKDVIIHGEFSLMKEHRYILSLFIYLFIGMVIAYAFWFAFLPVDTVNSLFSTQIETIESITGSEISITGSSHSSEAFKVILFSNIGVWIFCIIFSFLYGSGAIFILTWNASIIGVAAGNVFRTLVSSYSGGDHMSLLYTYFTALPISFSYLIHGIPEVSAYFIGALGGGIISSAVIKHNYQSHAFLRVIMDSIGLLLISLFILVAAAFVEVYVTPMTI